jgi:DNA repair exonuclease SbcCD ATPase subunit
MNFVGKIFIVLITAMSLIFMSFALMVYAAHRNWKNAIESTEPGQLGWRAQLKAEKEKNEALVKEREDLKVAVAAERLAQRQALAKLESQRDELVAKRDDLQKERDALNLKDQESVAALDTAQNALAKLTKEVEGLRKEIRLAQEERDKQFKQVVTTTDQIHQVSLELRVVKEREQQVAAQFARLKDTAAKLGWTGIEEVRDLHGKILAVNAEDLIEVSIGSHDGLKVGNTLEVFRGSKYLGRVEVVKLDTNRAVAKILRDFKQGPMQKGDDVASRLKLG